MNKIICDEILCCVTGGQLGSVIFRMMSMQSIDLIRKLERVQRRATKYILDLPSICHQTYGDRLMNLNLLPISYWHKFLDMIFFFKVVTGTVKS